MRLKVNFREIDEKPNVKFQEIHEISDGGYDKGYNDGYDKGYEVGYGESYDKGFDEGFIDGKQAEYDRFWDSFQDNGTKTRYHYAFCGEGWTQETLKPKYLIKPEAGNRGIRQMFMKCNWNNNSFIDFSLIKDKFDFSQCTEAENTFANCYIDNIDVDFSNCTSLNQTFNHSDNGKTPNIRLKVSEKTVFYSTFSYGVHTKVTFTEDSVIGQNGLSLKRQTQMEKSHITSVINALSTTTNNLSVELSLQAVNKAFETSEGANDGSSSVEWQTLVNTKTNWTINLS